MRLQTKKHHWAIIIICFCSIFSLKAQKKTASKMDLFIDQLMNKMTLEEKIGQLNLPSSGDIVTGQAQNSDIGQKIKKGNVGGLFNIKSIDKIREVQKIAVEESRLKIPLIFGMDVIHGYETIFPIPLALSCSWDMDLITQSAKIAADEASADGINWTFSPMVDIARDPRWGRIAEGSGEDPYLGYQIAQAMVRGYQGDDLSKPNTILSCVKHYALYGASESGRDYNTTDMSHQRMYNEYFPPYKGAIDAGVGSVMASFNDIDGVPATANKWLLTDVLKKEWGFKGMVVTDYTGINEMVDHGIGDLQTVSARALDAGIDMDMVGEGFLTTLSKSLQEKKIKLAQINAACRKILEAKYKLGLFDDPFRYCNTERARNSIYTQSNRDIARKTAAETFVLLKNDKNVLPLKKSGTIAIVGPLADNKENITGTWSVAAKPGVATTILEGLQLVAGSKATIVHARGANLDNDAAFDERATVFGKSSHRDNRSPQAMIDEALDIAAKADVVVAVVGESAEMTGEASSRSNLDIPQSQKDLLAALLKTGKPVVMVLLTGRPLTIAWENANIDAILNVWFPGSEGGLAVADVLFGDVVPSGKLTATWPQNVGQIPLYHAHKNTGRPLPEGKWFQKFRSNYLDVSNEPLYPFGYGLSYTTFTYGEMRISNIRPQANESIKVSIDVSNTGNYTAKETVQLYIRDVVGSVTRPVKELKKFQKVELKAGETRTIDFTITTDDLKFYDYNLNYVWEEGDFEIMVGPSANTVRKGTVKWLKNKKMRN